MKSWRKILSSIVLSISLIGFGYVEPVQASDSTDLARIEAENRATEKRIQILEQKIEALKEQLGLATKKTAVESVSRAALSKLTYQGSKVVSVNHNKPTFTKSELKLTRPWQSYGQLDGLNRVTTANALLNRSLMPHSEREPLYVNPTGWHNKRISSGWLYNRCHLIGYQLTGQNNNIRNLMTGTRQLNDPGMLRYENEVADYLKSSNSHYVRYRVTPVFRGNELLARGVEMEAQSIGSNAVRFNVYIFNVQPGVVLNYQTGTSRVG